MPANRAQDRDTEQQSRTAGRSRPRVRVLPALIGGAFLWPAVEFGLSGAWPLALLCLFLFGAVEALAFAVAPRKNQSRKKGERPWD
jgi:hypothetical protein